MVTMRKNAKGAPGRNQSGGLNRQAIFRLALLGLVFFTSLSSCLFAVMPSVVVVRQDYNLGSFDRINISSAIAANIS